MKVPITAVTLRKVSSQEWELPSCSDITGIRKAGRLLVPLVVSAQTLVLVSLEPLEQRWSRELEVATEAKAAGGTVPALHRGVLLPRPPGRGRAAQTDMSFYSAAAEERRKVVPGPAFLRRDVLQRHRVGVWERAVTLLHQEAMGSRIGKWELGQHCRYSGSAELAWPAGVALYVAFASRSHDPSCIAEDERFILRPRKRETPRKTRNTRYSTEIVWQSLRPCLAAATGRLFGS